MRTIPLFFCVFLVACAGTLLGTGIAFAETEEPLHADGGDALTFTLSDDEPLGAPTDVRMYVQEGALKIAWEPVEGATGYRVYKRTACGSFVQVGSDIQGARKALYRDTNVGPSATYHYKITALREYEDGDGLAHVVESDPSGKVIGLPALAMPVIYGVENGKLRWRPSAYATGYKVYEKAPGKSWKYLGSTSGTAFAITLHNNYHYGVRACRGTKTSDIDATFTYGKHRYRSNSVLILGDSIASGNDSYANRAMRLLGTTWTNEAFGGSWMAFNPVSEKKSIYTHASNLDFSKADIVVICAGTNDYLRSVEIGEPGNPDPRTFYGGSRAVLEMILAQNPKCRIVLCKPADSLVGMKQNNTATGSAMVVQNECGYTMEDYRAAVDNLATMYGCDIYDLTSTGDMTAPNIFNCTTDNLHPTSVTHKRIGDDFASFLVDNNIVRAPKKKCHVKSVWASKHDKGAVTFKWSGTNDKAATGWSIRYRTRVIGGNHKWSKWVSEDETDVTRSAKKAVKSDHCIEFAVRHDGDSSWSRSVFTCPAGGRYQAPQKAHVKMGRKRIASTQTVTVQVGKSVKLSPDPEYSVKNYKRRPRLYPTHGFWTPGDKALLKVTGKAGTSGMKNGDVLVKGLQPGKTTLKYETCNGRSCTITVKVVKGTAYRAG